MKIHTGQVTISALLSKIFIYSYIFQTTFLYFGLRFLRFTVPVDYGPICSPVKMEKDYSWPGWAEFKNLIDEDMDNLNAAGVGAKPKKKFWFLGCWWTLRAITPYRPHRICIFSYISCSLFFSWLQTAQGSRDRYQNQTNPLAEMCSASTQKPWHTFTIFYDCGLELAYAERIDESLLKIMIITGCKLKKSYEHKMQ